MAKKEYDVELEVKKTPLMNCLNVATGSFANTLQDGAIVFEKKRIMFYGINSGNYACAMSQLNKTNILSYKVNGTTQKEIDKDWLVKFKKHLSSSPKDSVTLQISDNTLHIRMENIHKKAIWRNAPENAPALGAFREGESIRKYADTARTIGDVELPDIMKFMHAAAHNEGDAGRPITLTIQKGKATIEAEIETGDTLTLDLAGISEFRKNLDYRTMFPADDLNEMLKGIRKLTKKVRLAGKSESPLIITTDPTNITSPTGWMMLAPRIEND